MNKDLKIVVIGAGISGLSIANLLKEDYSINIFETQTKPGGMIRCENINGNLFHITGGHVFNTKRKDVKKWFWKMFDKDNEFLPALRNATVSMPNGNLVPYPIENHAYMLSNDELKSFIDDLVNISKEQDGKCRNFDEFLRNRFGDTLYNIYFRPYNYKVWRCDLTKIPLSWLEGKLPMPTIQEMIYNNINRIEETAFVHSSFFYPKKNGSQFLADKLAEGLDIRYNTTIKKIEKWANGWIINDEYADKIIFCGNIKQIPELLQNQVDLSDYVKPIEDLESHGTTAVFCEIEKNPYSWVYMPSVEHQSHRIICTGNFSPFNNKGEITTATIEFTDYISKEDILENILKIPFKPKYLAHHYEKYTYPIQDSTTREMVSSLKIELEKNNFYLLGRFAEWEYFNMDAAMGAAIDLKMRLL